MSAEIRAYLPTPTSPLSSKPGPILAHASRVSVAGAQQFEFTPFDLDHSFRCAAQ